MRGLLTILWGLFCACSWTWCIGMYLPRIMIERFGWPGFVVFAIPNVIGCSAFGYLVRTRTRSEAMVIRHAAPMAWFSVATIAFHMFFIVWLLSELVGSNQGEILRPVLGALIVFSLGLVLSFCDNRDWLALAAGVYLISLVTFARLGLTPLESIPWHGEDITNALAWLAPAIIFGFSLCPYLDLTFHRAIQNSPSRHAFVIFGSAFFVMIILTIVIWFGGWKAFPRVAVAHILAQSVFTVGAHLRELRQSKWIVTSRARLWIVALPLLAIPLLYMVHGPSSESGDLEAGENLYLRFLGLYGWVFPAIVLWFMVMRANQPMILIALILVGLPMFESAFIGTKPWLASVAVLLVLIAAYVCAPRLRKVVRNPGSAGG
jgi:hypothetical protein